MSLLRSFAQAFSVVGPDDLKPAERHVAGRKFRRFGRMGADGRVITYVDHAADRQVDHDLYLDQIDSQTYGRPLPIGGLLFGQGNFGAGR